MIKRRFTLERDTDTIKTGEHTVKVVTTEILKDKGKIITNTEIVDLLNQLNNDYEIMKIQRDADKQKIKEYNHDVEYLLRFIESNFPSNVLRYVKEQLSNTSNNEFIILPNYNVHIINEKLLDEIKNELAAVHTLNTVRLLAKIDKILSRGYNLINKEGVKR